MAHFDIENKLRVYFPILFELLDNNSINWKSIEKTFKKKFDEHQLRHSKKGSSFKIQASFYNIITSAIKKEPDAIRFLDYMLKLFEELTDILDKNEKALIKNNIFGFLTNMDMKYLNFLGELAVLHKLKKSLPIKLLDTEVPLNSLKNFGSKIDFLILNTENNRKELVEVVNIHLSEKNTKSDGSISVLLNQKIGEKLSRKGLNQNGMFHLIPVLWGQWDEIRKIESYYSIHRPQFSSTTIPVCFMTFTDQNGTMVHKFGTIDTIFENALI